jgi:hypothetical protein
VKKTISPPEPILEKYLRAFYCKGSQHQKDEWPPSFNIEYINLVLIQQSLMPRQESQARESIKLAAKGQIEAIGGHKLGLENIMTLNQRVCLVIGAPGVGKTRLALKLCKDWGSGTLLGNFQLLLYVPLREPIARLSENIDELMNYFGDGCNESDREMIKKDLGSGVLFILDGWDELKLSCRGEFQFFPKLIRGKILPNCSIIVTSRPGATEDIRHHAGEVIDVLGFGEKQVNEYIRAYFAGDVNDGASKLISDLQEYPNVASTCYMAINLAIVCHVYHACGSNLPKTLTEVYEWFIIHTVLRFLQKKKSIDEINSELPSLDNTKDFYSEELHESITRNFRVRVWETLQNLGELALNGLEKDDLCFRRRDLVQICNLDAQDHQFDGFGLLKPVQISHCVSSELYYHFLHLSIQFMAAFYIEMKESEQMRCLIDNERRYDAIIRFFCGINQFKSSALRIFIKNAKPVRLFHFECVYEGQWKNHCESIAKQCSNTFKVDVNLLPQQWAVLGYIMANSESQWHFECLRQQDLEEKDMKCFRRHLFNTRSFYHFSLEDVCIEPLAIKQLADIFGSQAGLSELVISNCHLGDEGLSTILSALEHHKGLAKLTVGDTTATCQVLDVFLKLLPTLSGIEFVKLNIQGFWDEHYHAIIHCAHKRCKLRPHVLVPANVKVDASTESFSPPNSSSKTEDNFIDALHLRTSSDHVVFSESMSTSELCLWLRQQQMTQRDCDVIKGKVS